MSTTTRFPTRGTGLLATMTLAIGLMGVAATGCGLDVPSSVQPPEDTIPIGDEPVESVVPISDVRLESPSR